MADLTAPGGMNWTEVGALSAAVGVSCTIIGTVAVHFWRKFLPAARRWSRFMDHVTGVPADPKTGQDYVPGIFERLDHQDAVLGKQDEVLETIRHEVEFNNGSSVKDAVTRIEKRLDDHLATVPPPTTTINVNPQ